MFLRMAMRNIAIREDTYKKLVSSKRDDESFSDAIDRLLQKKTSLSSFAGIFDKNDQELKLISEDVKKLRNRARFRVTSW
jgi:predicted CopG family antitoxin